MVVGRGDEGVQRVGPVSGSRHVCFGEARQLRSSTYRGTARTLRCRCVCVSVDRTHMLQSRMTLARLCTHVVVMTAMSAGAVVVAQPRRAVSVEAGVGVARQAGPAGTVSNTYVTAPGGITPGWLAGLGVAAHSRVTIVADWATTGLMTATEPSRYFMTFHERRRDQFLTVGARIRLPVAAGFALEPMAGLAWTFTTATSRLMSIRHFPVSGRRRSCTRSARASSRRLASARHLAADGWQWCPRCASCEATLRRQL